jgi:glycosyltransferase involved in cell wall biosynthesis
MRAVASTDSAPAIDDDVPAAWRALRIAVVTETYPPDVNGVAFTVARAVDGLRRRRHRVQLVRLKQDRWEAASDAPADEIRVPGLPIPGHRGLQMGLPCTRTLAAAWSREPPDIVHIATEGPLGWSALRAARRLGLPVVSDFRTNFHTYSAHYGVGWLGGPIGAYLRHFHNRTLCTMVPTEALARELRRLGYERVGVVARGVDTQRFMPTRRSEALRREWGAGPDTRVLLCVSRLAPEKNLGLVCDAYKRVAAQGCDVRLVIVGDGPARADLEARCPNALFAGMQHGDELAAHYASADLFVFPSLTETYGNVVPEALASGLPVVAYDCAAAAELVRHGVQGLLAPVADAGAFVQCAADTLADASSFDAMRKAARTTALALDWEPVIDRLEATLLQHARAAPLDTRPLRELALFDA